MINNAIVGASLYCVRVCRYDNDALQAELKDLHNLLASEAAHSPRMLLTANMLPITTQHHCY
jgi:hypothetical protein